MQLACRARQGTASNISIHPAHSHSTHQHVAFSVAPTDISLVSSVPLLNISARPATTQPTYQHVWQGYAPDLSTKAVEVICAFRTAHGRRWRPRRGFRGITACRHIPCTVTVRGIGMRIGALGVAALGSFVRYEENIPVFHVPERTNDRSRLREPPTHSSHDCPATTFASHRRTLRTTAPAPIGFASHRRSLRQQSLYSQAPRQTVANRGSHVASVLSPDFVQRA